MRTVTSSAAIRPRDYVAVRGPDAKDFLQRMVSNDVESTPCPALLLTPKARVIAPLMVVQRGDEDYLLLTEEGLGEVVRSALNRARFAAKVEIEQEEHTSVLFFGEDEGIPNDEFGVSAAEVLDAEPPAELLGGEELERMRILAGRPRWGREIDDRVLPAEAGLTETHVSFTKGCYPGQEPIARLQYRGKANRALRVLKVEGEPQPDTDVLHGDKVVGRITSSVPGLALAYVRTDVPEAAELMVGGSTASLGR
ncbi:MAG: YgfZ/GcvT domain-containing protein [Gaiellaceae bacterium]